jgi:hypothetical protein
MNNEFHLAAFCAIFPSMEPEIDENCRLILVRRMRALLILASLLTACETTWQVHQGPNQKPELTATRRVFTF